MASPGPGRQFGIRAAARANDNTDSLGRQVRGNRQAYTLQSPGYDRGAFLIHVLILRALLVSEITLPAFLGGS